MHLLNTTPGGFVDDDEGIARIDQSPAEIIILTAADTELALLAENLPNQFPSVRLANILHLRQAASVDLYVDDVLQHAKLIIASILGGEGYWPYGTEQLVALAKGKNIPLVLVPGDDQPDPSLSHQSTVAAADVHLVWRYLREGGRPNIQSLYAFIGQRFFNRDARFHQPQVLPRASLYHPDHPVCKLADWQKQWQAAQPVAAIIFYRAHLQSGNTAVIDSLIQALQNQGLNPLPIALASLKEAVCMELLSTLLEKTSTSIILNTTAFAIASVDAAINQTYQNPIPTSAPVLQVILSGSNRDFWESSTLGLQPRDLAMNVSLPEVDGRIISRAVSFKGLSQYNKKAEIDVAHYQPDSNRCDFVAELAQRWTRLAGKSNADKKVALILANYPTREGRLGNGVGLDTPASIIQIINRLQDEGYTLADMPENGEALMQRLQAGVTNDPAARALRPYGLYLTVDEYLHWFQQLPAINQQAVIERWGPVENDPSLRNGELPIAGFTLDNIFIGIQPARGYNLDHYATYHDPDLVPPHAYLAFYFWLRHSFDCDAIMHVGKHGSLEWLPGKSLALSENCWPDLIFGPMPHIYPFIVNDPGEGSQAKRRTQAVIIDHLIPPLTRAETYGPLAELERLIDEYYQALQLDPKRAKLLRTEILDLSKSTHFDAELQHRVQKNDDENPDDKTLNQLDAYLCELKEAQIRDGLHIFGQALQGEQLLDTTVALIRLPRGDGKVENASLIRALCADFNFDVKFDPLNCDPAAAWADQRPAQLEAISDTPWRSHGDTRELLELLAKELLASKETTQGAELPATQAVLQFAKTTLATLLQKSTDNELAYSCEALNGRFVPAGPSGAPSRGRLDVLPTGRNFYSVDVRSVPTQTAWTLGLKSARVFIERYLQEHGDFPRSIGLSVWGTATMRTGGDDIAQAFALLGVRPVWALGSNRVTDFEIMPIELLDRPRVDVTLRISGFFRDAFMNVINLYDAAVNAVAELDEPEAINPIRARVQREQALLESQGVPTEQAQREARYSIFGSKPGAYGAGLQGLIDEGCWDTKADLTDAYVNWGGYAYGQNKEGDSAHDSFRTRLAGLSAVLHNQDNREHDILDSDDYYQFQGGMAAAVSTLSGKDARVFHMDHSMPEAPRARTLKEEINRVIRSRVINPKWLDGIKRHGYKGAFEMAATIDYLFAYDATAQVVSDYQYEMVTDNYLMDAENQQFMRTQNPAALKESTERMLEAIQRGMWENPEDYKDKLETLLLDLENDEEAGLE